jgi:predicted Fe-S protein YdhL (DUF1289 family)
MSHLVLTGFHCPQWVVAPVLLGENHGQGYDARPMTAIHITDIESAINFWREKSPGAVGDGLPAPTSALAEIYAVMALQRSQEIDESTMPLAAMQAWLSWFESTADTPCIAICSTSQGDAVCKGCGRTFSEVQLWTQMKPVQKRATWRRITREGTAWRFNKYAERVANSGAARSEGNAA